MNGSVSPVVGIRPRETAICMKAVSPMAQVSPTARYCPNGSTAVRAIRKPSQQKRANSETTARMPSSSVTGRLRIKSALTGSRVRND